MIPCMGLSLLCWVYGVVDFALISFSYESLFWVLQVIWLLNRSFISLLWQGLLPLSDLCIITWKYVLPWIDILPWTVCLWISRYWRTPLFPQASSSYGFEPWLLRIPPSFHTLLYMLSWIPFSILRYRYITFLLLSYIVLADIYLLHIIPFIYRRACLMSYPFF